MRYIPKQLSNEPKSLKEVRSTPGATYDDCNKAEIRKALLKEQGHICAYCMSRISDQLDKDARPKMTIEHYDAQSTEEQGKLNYLNMLGVCRGGEGKAAHLLHCDKSRGNDVLTVDPRNPSCEKLVRFTANGEVFSENERVDKDLDQTLNLNIRRLKSGRFAAIQAAKQSLKSHSRGAIQQQLKRLKKKNQKGKFQEYSQAAIYILRKKLNQL